MFLSREMDIKLYTNYTKTYICKMLYKIRSIKQIIFNKYAINLKMTTSQRSLRNSGLLQSWFEFNNFSFLIEIIDNIIYTSGSCHQNSNHWPLLSRVSFCILHCHRMEFWQRETDVYLTFTGFGIILKHFYVDFLR